MGYDLREHIELEEEEISPESLNLVSSVYLGPVSVVENSHLFHISKILGHLRHGNVRNLVRFAEEVAKGIPYFSVDVVQTPKDRTWRVLHEKALLKKNPLKKNTFGSIGQENH